MVDYDVPVRSSSSIWMDWVRREVCNQETLVNSMPRS